MQPLFVHAARAIHAGRPDDAEAAYRAWMAQDPHDPAPRYGLALLLLSRGAYAKGWALYESRADVPETGIRKPVLHYPEWRGEPVTSLLVWPEQGFGDQIMFARYLPEVVARGIAVTLIAPPPLARLFSDLGATVVEASGRVKLPPHDAWCLIGSLAHLVGTIPSAPYLPGGDGEDGVGVMAQGNPGHVDDANRSLPPEAAERLLALGRSLAPEVTGAADFEDTRALVAKLAAVVTVDTAVAHLAGAMGKPTWILLPERPDWRWGRQGDRTLWYPSARLVRQPSAGDWSEPLGRLTGLLRASRTLSRIPQAPPR